MKLLFLCPENFLTQHHGGVSTYIINLAEYLASQNHQVTILMPGKNRELVLRGVRMVSRSLKLRDRNPSINQTFWWRRKFFQVFGKRWSAFGWSVAWACITSDFVHAEGPFDVIESSEWQHGGMFIKLSFPDQKLVTKLHRSSWLYKIDNQFPVTLEDRVINVFEMVSTLLSDGITSPSNFLLRRYKTALYFFKRPIKVIEYGLLPLTSKQKQKSPWKSDYVLFAGRLEKAKGCQVLIEAFAGLVVDFPELKLVFVGEDTQMFKDGKIVSYRDHLQRFVKTHKLTRWMRFLLRKKGQELQKYYDHALAVIVPSLGNENQPLVILEALRTGKIVIASKTGGIPEVIVHQKNGLLFEVGNAQQLAAQIRLMMQQSRLRSKLEKGVQKLRERYTVARSSVRTLEFYRSL